MNNMNELIISMTGIIFDRRPTCAEILKNLEKYKLIIGDLKIPRIKAMIEQLMVNLPADSIFHQYLEKIKPNDEINLAMPDSNITEPMAGSHISNVTVELTPKEKFVENISKNWDKYVFTLIIFIHHLFFV